MKFYKTSGKADCLMLYAQLRLALAVIENLSSLFTTVLVFGFQFATILVLWLLFSCFNLLSICICIINCFLAGYLLLLCVMVLPTIKNIHTETKNLIKRKLYFHYSLGHKYSRKYYYYTLWKSQRNVYFTCSQIFILDKEVNMLYAKELINHLIS